MTDKREFRWTPEGYGGFMDFKEAKQEDVAQGLCSHEDTWLVGTHSCCTCVALYVRTSPTRCLMRQIDAKNGRRLAAGEDPPQNRKVSVAQGELIAQYVETQLFEKARNANWEWDASQKAIMCCPWPDHEGELYAGWYVIKAVNSFLNRKDIPIEAAPWGGFVVNQKTGELVNKFVFDRKKFERKEPQPDAACSQMRF